MGSSSGDDYSTPPANPAPPSSMISPPGQSTGYQPNFINFLGNTNEPSTGLTPQMLAAIMGSNGPPPGPPPGGMGGGGMGGPPQQQQGLPASMREGLARLIAEREREPRRWAEGGGMGGGGAGSGNRGGYGSSAGGRY